MCAVSRQKSKGPRAAVSCLALAPAAYRGTVHMTQPPFPDLYPGKSLCPLTVGPGPPGSVCLPRAWPACSVVQQAHVCRLSYSWGGAWVRASVLGGTSALA